MNHTDDCQGGRICTPAFAGDWNQPPGEYVRLAKVDIEGSPWCVIQERAWELAGAREGTCARCGVSNPEEEGSVPVDWEALTNQYGDSIGVICGDCVTPEEQQAMDEAWELA